MSPIDIMRTAAAAAFATVLATAQAPAPKAPAPQSIPAQAQPAPAPKEPEFVMSRDFKSKLFVVQHRSPATLRDVLRPLSSGFKGTAFDATNQDGLKTLSVRDFPENLAAIEEALKRLDVPSLGRKDVELHIHVLFASRQEGPSGGFPEELKHVLATLKSTLNYKSYTLATAFVQRVADGSGFARGEGQVEMAMKGPRGEDRAATVTFDWRIRNLNVEAVGAPATINFGAFELSALERRDGNRADLATVQSALSLKDGEKVVVGTSSVKDRGLIVVLTARVLK